MHRYMLAIVDNRDISYYFLTIFFFIAKLLHIC